MGSQYLYVLIAIFLFMNLVVTMNSHKTSTAESTINSQLQNDAISLAQSIIERGWSVDYDDLEDEFGSGEAVKMTFGAGVFRVTTDVKYAAFNTSGFAKTAMTTNYKMLMVSVEDTNRTFKIDLHHVFTEL